MPDVDADGERRAGARTRSPSPALLRRRRRGAALHPGRHPPLCRAAGAEPRHPAAGNAGRRSALRAQHPRASPSRPMASASWRTPDPCSRSTTRRSRSCAARPARSLVDVDRRGAHGGTDRRRRAPGRARSSSSRCATAAAWARPFPRLLARTPRRRVRQDGGLGAAVSRRADAPAGSIRAAGAADPRRPSPGRTSRGAVRRLRGMEIDASTGNEDAPEWVDLAVALLEAFGGRPSAPHPHVVGTDETARHLRSHGLPILTMSECPAVPGAVVRPLVEPVPCYPWAMVHRTRRDAPGAGDAARRRDRARPGGAVGGPARRRLAAEQRRGVAEPPVTVAAAILSARCRRRRRGSRRSRR